jgi:adenosylhomocysteine nucleosidase
MTGPHSHLGVIGALPEEVERLHELLADETVTEHVGRRFHSGRLGEQRVTLVQSRIGKVAAAVTASTLIRDFAVDAIIFTGVAGALSGDLRVGDVVVASELIQHDLQGPPELFARGEIPLLTVIQLPTDAALTDAAERAARAFLASGFGDVVTEEALARLGIDRPTVHVGQIATGDEFIHGDLKEVVRSRTPDAICVDMEGAAVAQVCLEHGGVPLCVIRAISDLASGTASVDFPLFLDTLARHYSAEILTRMFALASGVRPLL